VTKKKKIILIGVAVTLALVLGVGGLIYARIDEHIHMNVGVHKLIGVGEMGFEQFVFDPPIPGMDGYSYEGEIRGWDTQFIITNPNCDKDLKIEWVALIAGEDTEEWDAEEVIFEGAPPPEEGILSPHQVEQVSLAELLYMMVKHHEPDDNELYYFIADQELNKYTLEITWSGASWSWWSGWGKLRPLIGWQKEKCRHMMYGTGPGIPVEFPGLTISEAEMQLFPSKMPVKLPEI